MPSLNKFILLLLCIQNTLQAFSQVEYPFINLEKNQIQNSTSLKDLLKKVELEGMNTHSIVHIGDSHIQADFFTGKLRKLFQNEFGNAGRGLVFPYVFAKTNGHSDAKFTANNCVWSNLKIIKAKEFDHIGIPAIQLNLLSSTNCGFQLKFKDDSNATLKGFTELELIFKGDAKIRIQDQYGMSLKELNDTLINGLNHRIFLSEFPIDLVDFQIDKTSAEFELRGMLLKKKNPGIFYHSIGVNGAEFSDYIQQENFFQELSVLNPEMIVVSLGTNESVSNIDSLTFYNYLNSFYEQLLPYKASILFTTPADNDRRKRIGKRKRKRTIFVSNPKAKWMGEQIMYFCNEKNIACWNLYEVMGGENSMKLWVNNELAARDHLHFSKKGYALQAELLFEAIKKLKP